VASSTSSDAPGAAVVVDGRGGLRENLGKDLAVSDWHEVSQADVDAFAAATGDRQWIHVDPERAAAGPFGGTIAHGLLTLSLASATQGELLEIRGFSLALNYGYDRIRFPGMVPTGSRIRVRLHLAEVTEMDAGVQVKIQQIVELDGARKPVCVADAVSRYLDADPASAAE
jgi:acyl dehydratase